MSDNTQITLNNDLQNIVNILREDDAKTLIEIRDELADNWKKKQIFRTETEMRVSVLNDAHFPTPAAKYWQSVREMSAHFDGLMAVSFDLRRHNVKRLKLQAKMEAAIQSGDELKQMSLEIDLEENSYNIACMQQVAKDRIRELKNWSKIKAELNDGSFDDKEVNTHQAQSYRSYFENRVKSLNASSTPSEIMNAMGQFMTLERLGEGGKLLSFDQYRNKFNGLAASEQPKQIENTETPNE
jgi:hypothetical protein